MNLNARLLLPILVIVSCSAAYPQSTTGTLLGTVSDPSGGAMPRVEVLSRELTTNQSRPVTTNDSGNYSISNLPAGKYRLEFQSAGFKKAQSVVVLRLNEALRVDISMEVGPISEVVEVTAAPVLQKDTSSLGAVIDAHSLEWLPVNGRLLESYVQLLPGVVTAAPNSHLSSRGGFNVSGFDEHYMSFFIDGIDNVDPVIRNVSFRLPLDLVREMRVERSGSSAEFGRNAGAVINVTTKSGTNALHGSLRESLRNDNFDARNYFTPPDASKPSLIRNQFGATLGGALQQDRTFFFVGYEGIRQKMGLVRVATVPTALMREGNLSDLQIPIVVPSPEINPISRELIRAYPLPNRPGVRGNRIEIANRIEDGNDVSGRIDHHLTPGTRLMGRFSTSVTRVRDPFRTESGGSANLSDFGQTADRFRTNLGVTLTTVVGGSIVNELRAGYNRFRQPQIPLNRGTPALQPLNGFLKVFPFIVVGGFDPIGSGAEFQRAVNVYNYIDNLSLTRGNHQIKFGVDARRYLFNAYNVSPNIYQFVGGRGQHPVAEFLRGLPTRVVSFEGDPGGNTSKLEFAWYLQDDWKVTPRLTLNYGLRWEFYGRIKEKNNEQSFWEADCNCMRIAGRDAGEGLVDNDFNNFAPRAGFAWRPLGERTVIRGSSGIFYDNDMRHNAEFFINPPFFSVRDYLFNPASTFSLGAPLPTLDPALAPNTIDRRFRDTYAGHWSLSVQREVVPDLLVELAYVGNRSMKARRLRVVNQFINGTRPYPTFGPIGLFEQAGSSTYNAFEVRVERRYARGFAFTSAYTWGHAIDDRPGQGGGRPQDSYNLRAERGDSDFDVRHRWTASSTYDLPFGSGKAWGGWSMNAIATIQGGRPFTVNLPGDVSRSGNQADRPNADLSQDWRPANQNPQQWINPGAFTAPAPGTFGNLGRNTLRGPALHNLDVSLVKTHRIGDGTELQFRVESFNVFNHPNFSVPALPNTLFGLPTFGLISSTASPERQMQFGVKLGF